MKNYHWRNNFKIMLSAGMLLSITPAFVMAQQKQGNNGTIHLYTPGVSKPGDSLRKRKLEPGQTKHIMVNGNKNVDHMPIVSPDMKKYNMPVAHPRKHPDDTLMDNRIKVKPITPK